MSHLLFADDSLILFRADGGDARYLQDILHTYEECSGQMINKEKSTIMFSTNTVGGKRREVMQALNIQKETMNERYLGLLVFVGRDKKRVFAYLKDRIWQRIQGWKEKMLSKAGKEILIKAVAQAIPTYAMACFDITKSMCEQISKMICRYWWSSQEKVNKIHWISWEKLTRPKGEGGLGFRDIHAFNLAMLAKQCWRLIHDPESLCAQILRAKYYPNSSLLEATTKNGMYYTWRSILQGLKALKNGMIWRVGSGENIKIWEDPWIPREWTRRPTTQRGRHLLNRVCELIDPYTNGWDVDLVLQTFNEDDAKAILAIPVHPDLEDTVAWHFDNRGVFSVRLAYKVPKSFERRNCRKDMASTAGNAGSVQNEWKKLWNLKCPSKLKHFLWRLAHNSLALRVKLGGKGMDIDTQCVICQRFDEDGGTCFSNAKK